MLAKLHQTQYRTFPKFSPKFTTMQGHPQETRTDWRSYLGGIFETTTDLGTEMEESDHATVDLHLMILSFQITCPYVRINYQSASVLINVVAPLYELSPWYSKHIAGVLN